MTCYVAGIPRSGSTLCGQIARAVLPDWNVIATHPAAPDFKPGDAPVLASYRHPYDVIASRWRVRMSRAGTTTGTLVDLEAEIDVARQHFDAFLRLTGPKVVKLKYESFWHCHAVIYDALQAMFGITIFSTKRAELSAAYGLAANLERAMKLRDFNEWDEAGVHGAHIATPQPGGWRVVLPEWANEPTLKAMKPYCAALGYSC